MDDVNCPYCDHAQDIDHDDGYGYDESSTHEQACEGCDKLFAYTTSVHYYYSAKKADCLNGGQHKLRPRVISPKPKNTPQVCVDCGYTEQAEW